VGVDFAYSFALADGICLFLAWTAGRKAPWEVLEICILGHGALGRGAISGGHQFWPMSSRSGGPEATESGCKRERGGNQADF